jgi:Mak10 subunit, NatC N(alpha)-terminal acetyltransferase
MNTDDNTNQVLDTAIPHQVAAKKKKKKKKKKKNKQQNTIPVSIDSNQTHVVSDSNELAADHDDSKTASTTASAHHTEVCEPEAGWTDATAFFRDTAAMLNVGEMVHDEHFSLSKAMSALELMDRKMDPCVGVHRAWTYDEFLKSHETADATLKRPFKLTYPQQLQVIDTLLAQEAKWRAGDTTLHTVFRCLYVHSPKDIESELLRAFVQCQLKCIELVRDVVVTACIYDEEDFMPVTFGMDYADSISFDELNKIMDDALAHVSICVESNPTESDIIRKIEQRLRFVHALCIAQLELAGASFANWDGVVVPQCENAAKYLTAIRQDFPPPSVPNAPDEKEASGVDSNKKSKVVDVADGICGFHSEYALSLFPSVTRRVRSMPMHAALDLFGQFIDHLIQLREIQTMQSIDQTLNWLGAYALSGPDCVVRSYVGLFLGSQADMLHFGACFDATRMSMARFAPVSFFAFNEVESDTIIQCASSIAFTMLRVHCASPGRHRTSIQGMLVEWGDVMIQCRDTDEYVAQRLAKAGFGSGSLIALRTPICNTPYTAYATELAVHLMMDYLLLGIDLDLYGEDEYLQVYWYLDYLCDCRVQNRINAGSSGVASPRQPCYQPPVQTGASLLVEGQNLVCKAMVRSIVYLQRIGMLSHSEHPLCASDLMYDHRFEAFREVPHPAFLEYENHFLEAVNSPDLTPELLLNDGAAYWKAARTAINNVQNATVEPLPAMMSQYTSSLMRVTVMNSLELSKVSKLYSQTDGGSTSTALQGMKVTFDFSCNRHFPLIKCVVNPPRK